MGPEFSVWQFGGPVARARQTWTPLFEVAPRPEMPRERPDCSTQVVAAPRGHLGRQNDTAELEAIALCPCFLIDSISSMRGSLHWIKS